uniref:Helicase C-terminal domain-containing protein n=1 Tax=Amphimedon queenslandica TaxID=400682 RepID=A0A1X7VSU7_AMPQE
MRHEFTEPPGTSFIPECRLVAMFMKGTELEVKECITSNFTNDSTLRVVIATVAFCMGANCTGVNLVVHVGSPTDVENYVQGVDGEVEMGQYHTHFFCMPRNLTKSAVRSCSIMSLTSKIVEEMMCIVILTSANIKYKIQDAFAVTYFGKMLMWQMS